MKFFIRNTFSRFVVGDEITCPCKKCHNRKWHRQEVVYDHLIWNGPSELYVKWICEVSCLDPEKSDNDMDREAGTNFGDNLDEMLHRTCGNMQNNEGGSFYGANGVDVDARKFHHHVEEGKQQLYLKCTKFLRLSFIVGLYSLKCLHGITESAFTDLLELLKEAFPQAHIPLSFNATKNIIKDLGLDYQRIHACPNDSMLYWAENEKENNCKSCGFSRWVIPEEKVGIDKDSKKRIHKVPAKVIRYFPLKPRL